MIIHKNTEELHLLYLYFCFFGCSGAEVNKDESPSKKVEVLRTPKHVSSTKEDYNQKSFLCCTDKNIQAVLTTYIDLTQSMAQDQEEKALANLQNLQEQISEIQNVDKNTEITTLKTLIKELQPTSLSDLQDKFAPFSIKMVEWIKPTKEDRQITEQKSTLERKEKDQSQTQEGDSTHDTIRVIAGFCPMAPPPGRWLQREDIIQNPFYGSKMLTCGVFE